MTVAKHKKTNWLLAVIAPTPPPHNRGAFRLILTHNERAETHLFDDVFNDPIQCSSFFTTFMTRNPNENSAVALGMAKPIALAHEII